MKIGLTLKAIVRWEQLTGKPFSTMDYSSEEDVEALFYTASVCNNIGQRYTLEEFKHIASNKKLIGEIADTLSKESAVMAQFQQKESTETNQNESEPGYIGEIVFALIISGLNAHYVLNEMELCDLPMYIKAYEHKKKEEMESSRLWTYLSILPHVDSKKLQSPRDLYMFPWEEEQAKAEADEAILRDTEAFEQFIDNFKKDN